MDPANRSVFRHIARIRRRIANHQPVAEELNRSLLKRIIMFPLGVLTAILKVILWFVRIILSMFVLVWDTSGKSAPIFDESSQPVTVQLQPPNPYEEELQAQAKEKIDQPLFETSVRLLVVAEEKHNAAERVAGFLASLGPFATVYQALETKTVSYDFTTLWSRFRERRLSSFQNPILTASELTDLYHFPYAEATQAEGLVRSRTRDLPAPLSQKQNEDVLDVVIGENTYGGEALSVGLTAEQRHQHTYIVGKTGMGKSTIIAGMALQDMAKGKGLCVVDPHGDLVNQLLTLIPAKRRKDVIYVNPADKEFPIGLNVLNPGVEFADKEEEREWITGSVMSIFMKITPPARWGQRMEHILRNACLTVLSTPPSAATPYVSLYTIQKLLTDTKYRKEIATSLPDPVLKQFWLQEFNLFGKMQQADAISPLTNKLGEFLTSPLSRRILLQEKSTLNFSELMDSGKILLVNLSKGKLGEERSAFFGTVIVSLIQLATYARERLPENKRRDFFVYIDEFQNFATPHFTALFSESRKFHVFFIPTHQSIAQIEDSKISSVISGNAGTLISLKVGPNDEAFVLPFMQPEVKKSEIVNLPPHHFFMKVTSGASEDSFSGVTIPIDKTGNPKQAAAIIRQSQGHYATQRAAVEAQLGKLFGDDTPTKTEKPEKKAIAPKPKPPTKLHKV